MKTDKALNKLLGLKRKNEKALKEEETRLRYLKKDIDYLKAQIKGLTEALSLLTNEDQQELIDESNTEPAK